MTPDERMLGALRKKAATDSVVDPHLAEAISTLEKSVQLQRMWPDSLFGRIYNGYVPTIEERRSMFNEVP